MSTKKFSCIQPILLLIGAVFLAACNVSSNAATEPAGAAVEQQVAYKTSDGLQAPNWSLKTLDGGTFTLAEHQGEVVVMFFMASWCGSCIPEALALAELHERYAAKGLTVVAINVEPGEKTAELENFRQVANNAGYVWAFDSEFTVTETFDVQSLETTFIIDRSGRIAYSDFFSSPLETLEAEILKWL